MSALTLLAVAATGMAIGGVAVASWREADRLVVSLLAVEDINREADADRDDWVAESWWVAR